MKIFKQWEKPEGLIWKKARKKPYTVLMAKLYKDSCTVDTPEGAFIANSGDYIVQDIEGNQFVVFGNNIEHNFENIRKSSKLFIVKTNNQNAEFEFYEADRTAKVVEYSEINSYFKIEDSKNFGCDMGGFPNDMIIQTPGLTDSTHIYRIVRSVFFKSYDLIYDEDPKYAIFISRVSPLHIGHQNTISTMINDVGIKNSLMLIGSSNSVYDERLCFNYMQRKEMVKTIFPDLTVCGLPDYKHVLIDPTYTVWKTHLWDMIRLKFSDANTENTIFYSGSEEDVFFFVEEGYRVKIVNRINIPVSATDVRNQLRTKNGDITGLVDERLKNRITIWFRENEINKLIKSGEKIEQL